MRGSAQFRRDCACRGGVGLVLAEVVRFMEAPVSTDCGEENSIPAGRLGVKKSLHNLQGFGYSLAKIA
jgi:hypothetical protein